MAKYFILTFALVLSSCSLPVKRYELPPPSWYESQNYNSLSYWISYWEKVLQEENRKCYYNFPHDHDYHRYVIKHLDILYNYRSHMELWHRECKYDYKSFQPN